MRWRGINIDNQLFDLIFEEPQNFASYRQAEVDSARIATFTQLEGFPYMSKRFLMKRYLGMSEAEIAENEIMWKEEHGENSSEGTADVGGLRSVGITPGGIEADADQFAPPPVDGAAGAELGGAPAPAAPGAAPAPPGAAPPAPLPGI